MSIIVSLPSAGVPKSITFPDALPLSKAALTPIAAATPEMAIQLCPQPKRRDEQG